MPSRYKFYKLVFPVHLALEFYTKWILYIFACKQAGQTRRSKEEATRRKLVQHFTIKHTIEARRITNASTNQNFETPCIEREMQSADCVKY